MPTVLQITLSEIMQKSLDDRIKPIGISKTAYIKILLAKDLGILSESADAMPGNLFNADRDNNGQGIQIADFKNLLGLSPKA